MRDARATVAGWIVVLGLLAGCESGTVPKPEPSRPPSATATPAPTSQPTGTAAQPVPAPQPAGPADSATAASNAFGLDLYKVLAKQPGNLAMSPASLSIALGMTYGGARADTAAEMAKVMHLPAADELHGGWATQLNRWSKEMPDVELRVANRLFGDKSYKFEQPFVQLTADRYAAPLEMRNFKEKPEQERVYINDWVKQRTKDRIVDLIPKGEVTGDTRMVLANALYLKAAWIEAFNDKLTKDETFYAGGSKEVKVPMMSRSATMRYAETNDVQLVELDYKGRELGMLIALPKQRTGLAAVEGTLNAELVQQWVAELKGQRVWLTMPRFKVEPAASLKLKPVLKSMGMKLAFDPDHADFTGMFKHQKPADRLCIGNVFHKAFVAVDEKGTEAAAATAVVMMRAGGKPAEPARFNAEHPFLFFIRDVKTSAILFVGRVVDPS